MAKKKPAKKKPATQKAKKAAPKKTQKQTKAPKKAAVKVAKKPAWKPAPKKNMTPPMRRQLPPSPAVRHETAPSPLGSAVKTAATAAAGFAAGAMVSSQFGDRRLDESEE